MCGGSGARWGEGGASLYRFFWRNQTHCLQSGPSPSAGRIFFRILFGKGIRSVLRPVRGDQGLGACERNTGARCPLPRGPRLRALGDPSRAGAAAALGPAGGARAGVSPPPTGPGPPESQLPVRPSGPRARGRLDGSPCRSALSPPRTQSLRTSPPNLFSAVN